MTKKGSFRISLILLLCLATVSTTVRGASVGIDNLTASLSDGEITVSWDAVAGAAKYNVELWQVVYGKPSGTIEFEATFDDVENAGTGSKKLSAVDAYDAWDTQSVSIPKKTIGLVQVGSEKIAGSLVTPQLSVLAGGTYTLEICAFKTESTPFLVVNRIRGAETNEIQKIDVGGYDNYVLTGVGLAQNDRLEVCADNDSGNHSVRVDSIRLISGSYQAGDIATNYNFKSEGIAETAANFRLEEGAFAQGNYGIRVTALDADGITLATEEISRCAIFPSDGSGDSGGSDENTGNVSVTNITAQVVATTPGAFSIKWESMIDFDSYTLHLWTNRVVGASEGECVWREDFSNAPSSSSTQSPSKDNFKNYVDNGYLKGDFDYSKVYLTEDAGVLRLGNSSDRGWLQVPPLGLKGNNLSLKVKVKKCPDETGFLLPIDLIDGNQTNQIALLTITDEYADYVISLPTLDGEESLIIHSTTNVKSSAQTLLDSFEILAGASLGHVVSYTNKVDVGTSGFAIVSNQPSAVLHARVEGRKDDFSCFSNECEIDLENPSNFWLTSLFKKQNAYSVMTEVFGWVTNITKETSWMNGKTIRGFYAFVANDESESIYCGKKGSSTAGLYASHTNTPVTAHTLSLHANKNEDITLELRILNDRQKTMNEITFVYNEYDWMHNNIETSSKFLNSYSVTKNAFILPTNWQEINVERQEDDFLKRENDLSTMGFFKRQVTVMLPVKVNPGEVFYYRWIAPKMSNAPMLGVGNLTVTLGWKATGFKLIFR